MLYSCFDDKRAVYRVYEDDRRKPINGDLPVPQLPGDAGRIGVASIEAARPFPTGASYRGESWRPRGIIVRCPGSGLGALGLDGDNRLHAVLAAAGIAIIMFAWWYDQRG